MKKQTTPSIPARLIEAGKAELARVIAPLEGVHVALLCTPDGFEIASLRVSSDLSMERLSAMAGSLIAMAMAVATEIGHRSCRRLTFETELGTVVFQSVGGHPAAILCMVLDKSALLGRALWAAGEVVAGLQKK
ncbi:roadblock/LC7 domain-containing protein [Comamonas composti]|uniref:roadblock/LC7 domain-containing protein n=1 Tax=Comamonas composti TaxID=408558 RepID=UPI0004121FDF|nr:roadblock/LC7 domain-containing protein [Comamonas composti]